MKLLNKRSFAKIPGTKPNSKMVYLIPIFFIGLVLMGYAAYTGLNDEVVFSIDGKKYKKQEIQNIIKYSVDQGIDQNEAAKHAMQSLKIIQVGENLGIKVNEDRVVALKKNIIIKNTKSENLDNKEYEPWFSLLAKETAVREYLSTTRPGYKGYSFDFYFGQHIQQGSSYTPEGLNDKDLIAKDRSIAKQRADYYYDQLKNKKLKPEEILKQVKQDPELKLASGANSSASTEFGNNQDGSWKHGLQKPIAVFVEKQTKPGLKEIQIGKASASADQSEKDYPELYFFFVYLESAAVGKTVKKADFDAKLKGMKEEFKGF